MSCSRTKDAMRMMIRTLDEIVDIQREEDTEWKRSLLDRRTRWLIEDIIMLRLCLGFKSIG